MFVIATNEPLCFYSSTLAQKLILVKGGLYRVVTDVRTTISEAHGGELGLLIYTGMMTKHPCT